MLIKYLISIALMFVYLFSVNVTFLPSLISTRWFLAVPGALLMLIYYKNLYKKTIHYKKTMNSFLEKFVAFLFYSIMFKHIKR